MKLALSDLESARSDPAAYRQGVARPRIFAGGLTKNRVLQLATYEYHRRGDRLPEALQYFRTVYARNFKLADRLNQLEEQLAEYAAAYRAQGNIKIETRLRVTITVTDDLILTGEIPRLDIAQNGGYAVWLFARRPYEWRDELRMPLLQNRFARMMGVPCPQVTIGVYYLELGEYEQECYDLAAIGQAQEEARQLAIQLTTPLLPS